jgi:uncharacterized protein YjbI with pentapeptide repeats
MTAATQLCTHEFPLPAYEDAPGEPSERSYLLGPDDLGVDDGIWTCPHEAAPGRSKCVFHLAPGERPPDCDITRAFIDQVSAANQYDDLEARRRHRQFIDATFDHFAPESTVIGGQARGYIDCRHASFHHVDCERTEFEQHVRFDHATFGPPDTEETLDSAATAEVRFRRAVFHYNAAFSKAEFREAANFRGAQFHNWTGFRWTRFRSTADFEWATFHDVTLAPGARFEAEARFRAVGFEDYVSFTGARFEATATYDLARFADDADFPEAHFAGATFREAEFGRAVNLSAARITAPLRLDDIAVATELEAKSLQIGAPVRLDGADLAAITVAPTVADAEADKAYVRLANAAVSTGRLDQPDTGLTVYDVSLATLGDVGFHGTSCGPLYQRILFNRTRFDGFDFSDGDDLDAEAVNHKIHTLGDAARRAVPEEHDHSFTPEDRWATYLYAKNGADAAGDNVSAGAFFYKEMVYRRHAHWARMRTDETRSVTARARDLTKWGRNLVLGGVTGYGEKPDRVVYTSLVVILGFTPLYGLTAASRPPDASALEYLALSIQTYVSFVLGQPPGSFTLLGEIISAAEAFIGAFLVALFVFTLTRRVNR